MVQKKLSQKEVGEIGKSSEVSEVIEVKDQKKVREKIKGVFTAIITPFSEGRIDFDSLENLVNLQLKAGINGFVVNGTTGESPTVTEKETEQIFAFVKGLVPKDFPLVVGTGSNSTAKTLETTEKARRWGADAALVVVPYYNKPPQRGLFLHFKTIAENGGLPVILYNVPSRTVASLSIETIVALSQVEGVIGIKEATGNLEFAKQIREKCGRDFVLLSGDDGTYQEFFELGGDGVISVASHIIPEQFVFRKLSEFKKLIDLLFIEANPIPVKAALKELGVIKSSELRLPLVSLQEPQLSELKKELSRLNISKH